MEIELSLEFLRVVEKAAIESAKTMGLGDGHKADQAAVEAMRKVMDEVPMDGTIVRALLQAGAWRVEGGMTKETYLDFLGCLASMLLGSDALLLLLRFKALEQGVDWEQIRSDLERWVGASVSPRSERE